MLEIGCRFPADIVVVDKRDIVTLELGLYFEAVEQCGKKFMRQASASFINEENAEVVGAVRFQRTGGGIDEISELIRCCPDPVPGFFPDVRLIIQSLADCSNRNTTNVSDV